MKDFGCFNLVSWNLSQGHLSDVPRQQCYAKAPSHTRPQVLGTVWKKRIFDDSKRVFNRLFILKSCSCALAGLHKLWYPGIRDMSTWSKFGAHGEHGDVFLFSILGALWFSENLIRYSLHVCLREVKNNLFSFKHSLFTAFLVMVLKILT